MPRLVYGPAADNALTMGTVDQPITLSDVRAANGTVSFDLVVPPVQPGQNRPAKIYGVAAPNRPGPDVAAADFLVAPGNVAAVIEVGGDASQPQSLTIDVPGVPNGIYYGQTILEFAE